MNLFFTINFKVIKVSGIKEIYEIWNLMIFPYIIPNISLLLPVWIPEEGFGITEMRLVSLLREFLDILIPVTALKKKKKKKEHTVKSNVSLGAIHHIFTDGSPTFDYIIFEARKSLY